ncbi:MAG: FAD-dependent oxidoreductase [Gemmatimonadetes bacterium]|nr:FAD-dependent oxidoreductase [Gemmatimonadota bacterium]
MPNTQDVVIIGGGAAGAACARELAGTGRKVLVLEPTDRAGEAWRASAGLLAPQIDSSEDPPLFELGIAGREYYRSQVMVLRDETGIDCGLFDGGILRLARGADQATRLRDSVAWQRQHGHRTEWMDPTEVQSEYPWVGLSDGALFAPQDGSIDPIRLVEAFRASAAKRGATFEPDAAVGVVVEGGRVVGVRGARATYSAGAVVLAAGAWSGRLEGLPRPVSVEPVKGQMVAKRWPTKVPPGIYYSGQGYVLERNGEALCGSTSEHVGFSAEATAEGEQAVVRWADSVVPALSPLKVERRWAGLRPGTPDGLSIVGAEPNAPGLWYATGGGRNGILLAGITAVSLCHLMAGEATFEGIEALRPGRFWS